jgi:hypothetical protein
VSSPRADPVGVTRRSTYVQGLLSVRCRLFTRDIHIKISVISNIVSSSRLKLIVGSRLGVLCWLTILLTATLRSSGIPAAGLGAAAPGGPAAPVGMGTGRDEFKQSVISPEGNLIQVHSCPRSVSVSVSVQCLFSLVSAFTQSGGCVCGCPGRGVCGGTGGLTVYCRY